MDKVKVRVFKNGDDSHLVWEWPSQEKIPGCRGFAVYRRLNGKEEVIPSHAGWEDETWEPGTQKPSTVWPIQKFMWTDYTVRSGDRVCYRVVPMLGDKSALQPDENRASDWTHEMTLDAQISHQFACYFNRGIVATQWVQKMLGPKKSVRARAKTLDSVVVDYSHPKERNLLAGELREGLLQLLTKARAEELKVYAALFELADEELIKALAALGKRAFVVLADGALSKGPAKKSDNDVPSKASARDENLRARKLLKSKVTLFNRMTKGKFLAHNKILVVCDKDGEPRWTWTGSTNWTPSGLCTQANNGILIDDKHIASAFRDQVILLQKNGGASSAELANQNSKPKRFANSQVTVWFTRTNKQVDLTEATNVIKGAKRAALFLMFQTGAKGSLLEAIMNHQKDKNFYIHGVISSQPPEGKKKKNAKKSKLKGAAAHDATLAKQIAFVHKGERTKYAPDLLLPMAIERKIGGWFEEFVRKNKAHAIVHSKIVVLDPFGDNPIVMTGSHNMGKTASQKNDENLVIIQGDRALAEAYVVNIMSIYDNYRWRYRVASKTSWRGLKNNDTWQLGYIQAGGTGRAELDVWFGR